MKKDLKELISYVFVGGCTTLINFVIYWFVITMMDQGWLFANVISWVGAVIFAFWANKHFVFKSANETGKEAYQFFILRLGTLLVESGLLFIFIQVQLSFYRSSSNSLNNVLLASQIEDNYRNYRKDQRCHNSTHIYTSITSLHILDRN